MHWVPAIYRLELALPSYVFPVEVDQQAWDPDSDHLSQTNQIAEKLDSEQLRWPNRLRSQSLFFRQPSVIGDNFSLDEYD